jgi:hypothetical protein
MPFPVTRRRERVHGVKLIAGGHQGGDEQAPVGFDADDNLGRFCSMRAHQFMETSDAVRSFGEPCLHQPLALGVGHVYIVMVLSPVHTDKDHFSSPFHFSRPAPA